METLTFGREGGCLRCDETGIKAAVDSITKDTRHREMRCLERRNDSRLPFQRGVEVFPLRDDDTSDPGSQITAYTRDISQSGVGLMHDEAIQSSRVLLRFELHGGESMQLVVLLTWCRYLGDFWYSSGGRLLGVVSTTTRG